MSQKEKREELQKSITASIEQLATITDSASAEENFKGWLQLQSRFHKYSWGNTWLIHMQCPQATRVAGFGTWKKLKRFIKKGSKAIKIWCPRFGKKKVSVLNPTTGKKETQDEKFIYFVVGNVFDVSQTDGEDLPTLGYRTAEGCADDVMDSLHAYCQEHQIGYNYVTQIALAPGAKGASYSSSNLEVVTDLPSAQKASTLIHEIAHCKLHWNDDNQLSVEHTNSSREVEAEGVAYVVMSHLGFDMSGSRFYLACWNGDGEAVKASMKAIATVSKEILEFIQE